MVDREARNKMIVAIESWLSGNVRDLAFGDAMDGIANATDDGTVKNVHYHAWFLYDDIYDKPQHLNKDAWNFVQRLLLLLHSDAEWKDESSTRRWRTVNLIALGALLALVVGVLILGLNPTLVIGFAVFCVVLHRIDVASLKELEKTEEVNLSLYPFVSLSQMIRVYKSVRDFRKIQYGSHSLSPERFLLDYKVLSTFIWSAFVLAFIVFGYKNLAWMGIDVTLLEELNMIIWGYANLSLWEFHNVILLVVTIVELFYLLRLTNPIKTYAPNTLFVDGIQAS